MPNPKTVARCDEYSVARRGVCDRPLDEHGQCDRASQHGDHLADNEPIDPLPQVWCAEHGQDCEFGCIR